ncbi:MAG: hypothetical protein AAGF91_17385 [Actinomycetota bacterium]
MTIQILRPRSSLVVAGGAAALLALSACGSSAGGDSLLLRGVDVDPAADSSPNDGVRLVNAGDTADRITLPIPFEEGQSASTETVMELDMTVDGRSAGGFVDMVMTQRVTEELAGGAEIETIFQHIEGAAVGDDLEFDDVVGVPFVSEVDAAGFPTGDLRRADGGPMPAALAEQLAQGNVEIDFPTEPVGAGAAWTSVAVFDSMGAQLEIETLFELVEVDAVEYRVEITQNAPIDVTVDGVDITGSIEATGTMIINRDNPLDVDTDYLQTSSASFDGIDLDLTIEVTTESTSLD